MFKKGIAVLGFMLVAGTLSAAERWIDVRVPEQYSARHIDGAINVPLATLSEQISTVVENKEDSLHLYCNSGRQSALAKRVLLDMGYNNVIDEGGFDDAQRTFAARSVESQ